MINVKLHKLLEKFEQIELAYIIENKRSDDLFKKWKVKNPEPENKLDPHYNGMLLNIILNGFYEVEYGYMELYQLLKPFSLDNIENNVTIPLSEKLYALWLKL